MIEEYGGIFGTVSFVLETKRVLLKTNPKRIAYREMYRRNAYNPRYNTRVSVVKQSFYTKCKKFIFFFSI